MTQLQSLALLLFGPSWRTSLLGYLGAGFVEAAARLDALPTPAWKGWHIVALFLVAFGRVAKDAAVSGASKTALGLLLLGFVGLGTGCKTVSGMTFDSGTFDVGGGAKCNFSVSASAQNPTPPPACIKKVTAHCTTPSGLPSDASTTVEATCP